MIRFIVENISSKADINGNRHHLTRVTSTKTGCYLFSESGGQDNIGFFIRKNGIEWDEMYTVNRELPIRQWNKLNKDCRQYWEHELKPENILNLEI